MRSSGERVQTSQKRYTGACHNGELVPVRGTLRHKGLGHYELVAAIGEGSHKWYLRLTLTYFLLKYIIMNGSIFNAEVSLKCRVCYLLLSISSVLTEKMPESCNFWHWLLQISLSLKYKLVHFRVFLKYPVKKHLSPFRKAKVSKWIPHFFHFRLVK